MSAPGSSGDSVNSAPCGMSASAAHSSVLATTLHRIDSAGKAPQQSPIGNLAATATEAGRDYSRLGMLIKGKEVAVSDRERYSRTPWSEHLAGWPVSSAFDVYCFARRQLDLKFLEVPVASKQSFFPSVS